MGDSKHLLENESAKALEYPAIEDKGQTTGSKPTSVWDVTHEQSRRLRLPTAEEMHKLREMAQQEGYQAGYQAGFKQVEAERDRLVQIAQQMAAPLSHTQEAVSVVLNELVEKALCLLLQRELQIDSSGIGKVIEQALTALDYCAGDVRVHLNPEDWKFWDQTDDSANHPAGSANVQFVSDHKIKPGGCVVHTDSCQIDATMDNRLKQVVDGLWDRQHTPGKSEL